jgi:hypothetical protein
MKGIGHFLTGLAVATCFPEAMRATLDDNSLIILFGGACGLLPDTLDFRVGRYLWKHDHTFTPDLERLDAQPIAELVAKAIDEAGATRKPVRVKLNTLKISANYHRTYSIKIIPERKVVRAEIGPLKTMGQIMGGGGHLPRSLPQGGEHGELVAEAPYTAEMVNTYHARTTVGIFSGPDFSFVPDGDHVRMDFIPWHRTWAHAPALGVLCGVLGWLLWGLSGMINGGGVAALTSPMALTAFGVGLVAFWGHTFVDQFGVLGSVLFWPFSDKRSGGFKWTHAASILGNITLNYVCIAVIMWNLIVHTHAAGVVLPWAASMDGNYSNLGFYLMSLANYAAYYLAIPLFVLHVGARIYRKYIPAVTYPDPEYAEIAEADEARGVDDEGFDGPGELGSI